MTPDLAAEICRNAVMVALMISLPTMVVALMIGFILSLAQAVTQMQEQLISFVPKIIATAIVLVFTLPWVLTVLHDYSRELFENIPRHL